MKKTKLPKTKSVSKEKAKAWALFSIYIRLKACDEYKKHGMEAPCFTCGSITHYKQLQAGHFLQGRGNAILFDERGVHAQCMRCNIFLRGNPDEYWPKMIKLYGQEIIDDMLVAKHKPVDRTLDYYIDLQQYYKVLIEKLNSEGVRQ